MERRVNKRKNTKINVKISCFGTFFYGTVTDLSEKGMFINAIICFPIGSTLEIIISSNKEVLIIPVKVNRVLTAEGIDRGMGVELFSLSKEYLELLIKLDMGYQI